ncbi:NAD(P)-dependent oxidoreductase [Subtercola sp. RTI3]|uniref:NAD(P)-dependent oxidoreductase n=1 Tax=Subtercola sp. RTI3 TaxID=3048639 RepID=UPI002B228841|nr:DUF1932 domain-containing protein [Subtercola sp. RTI3]MEA9984250.1 DUF1932 domain-containing protein [Subtercola sp. RTI3]
MTTAAIIGLGEAGAIYARGLRDKGFTVQGYDPFLTLDEPGIAQSAELAEALRNADVVVSLVGARAALSVAELAVEVMAPDAVFADFNTGSPALKTTIGELCTARGIAFADVAVLAPVPRHGAETPLMASGSGADRFLELLRPVGAPLESIAGAPGDAAARKLIRSVFMKGLAAVVLESVNAARHAGCEEWLRGQIIEELSGDNSELIDRLLTGSVQHAGRRVHEVEDAHDYLVALGQPSWATDAAHEWLSSFLKEEVTAA